MLDYPKLYILIQDHFIKHNKLQRFNHSVRVVEMALKLNKIHNLNVDEELIKVTGILHDYAKVYDDQKLRNYIIHEFGPNEEILIVKDIHHALVGDNIIKEELGINNEEILDAVKYHSTGKPNMSNLCKLIFLSDYIELGRTFSEAANVRELAYNNIDSAIIKMCENTINYLESKSVKVFGLTKETYDYYIKEEKLNVK